MTPKALAAKTRGAQRAQVEEGVEEYLLEAEEARDLDPSDFGDCYCDACLRELYVCDVCTEDSRTCGHSSDYVDEGT